MKLTQIALTVLLSAATAYGVMHYTASTTPNTTYQKKETTFERVMRTGTLRCGYAIATPWFMTDPNTKKHSGAGYDVTQAVAKKIGVDIDWVEETDWGLAEQGLIARRYDMMCGSVCIDPKRARAATYSTPFLHIPALAVVRAKNKEYDTDLASINKPTVRVGVKSGHVFEYIANELFPLAKKVYANSISDDAEFLQMLKYNKIDVAFAGQTTVDLYNKHNPDHLVRSLKKPVRFCNGAFMVPLGDMQLKAIIDNTIGELNSDGAIKAILNRYVKDDPRYIRTPTQLFNSH